MDINFVQNKYNEIQSTNLYNEEQLEILKYVLIQNRFPVDFLLNPNMSADYMNMYVQLEKLKVPIESYIINNFHELGFNSEQLYCIIFAHYHGYDLTNLPRDISIDEIKNQYNTLLNNDYLEKLISESNISQEDLSQILNQNLPHDINCFLLRMGKTYQISNFIANDLANFSLEQIKYLFSLYTIGTNIDKIFNPNLSVDKMKEIISYSDESVELMQMIQSSLQDRKSK